MGRASTLKRKNVNEGVTSLTRPSVKKRSQIDWGGVQIVNPPSQVVSRVLPGSRGAPSRVDMDLRAFTPSRASSVVSKWISKEIDKSVAKHALLRDAIETKRGSAKHLVLSRSKDKHSGPSWFDTVAHLVADIVYDTIPYESRAGTAWQLPEETLARGAGDCEDRAILLAAALIAAGVSPYNVRVALGSIAVSRARAATKPHAHAWVVYRDEEGHWHPLEPMPSGKTPKHAGLSFVYQPDYVFNGDHQWSMTSGEAPSMRERWNELDPTFHGEIHRNIVQVAAVRAKLPEPLRSRISRTFTVLVGNVIDKPDLNFRDYHPQDHFDSGLIDSSWKRVQQRLNQFYRSPITSSKGISSACWAVHAIADFYSHSTYAHFLAREGVKRVPYDPVRRRPLLKYDYPSDPAFCHAKLTSYSKWWKPSDFDRLKVWKGHPISGRYSLPGDSQNFFEAITNAPNAFPSAKARKLAGSLPHHDEIAVDEAGSNHSNKIYSKAQYAEQFKLRRSLAIAHIANALAAHPDLASRRK